MAKTLNKNASKDSRRAKRMSHGTYRCKRHPNSPKCKK